MARSTSRCRPAAVRPPDQPQDAAAFLTITDSHPRCAGLPRLDAGQQPVAVDAAASDLRRARRRLPRLTHARATAAAAEQRGPAAGPGRHAAGPRAARLMRWLCRRDCRTHCARCGGCWATRSPSSPAGCRDGRCAARRCDPSRWPASMAARSATRPGQAVERPPLPSPPGDWLVEAERLALASPGRAAGTQGAWFRVALSSGSRGGSRAARGSVAPAGRLRRRSSCCRRICFGRCGRAAPTRARRWPL